MFMQLFIHISFIVYDHCGYVNVFVGNLPATGDVYGVIIVKTDNEKSSKPTTYYISFTCDSFTPYSSSVAKCSFDSSPSFQCYSLSLSSPLYLSFLPPFPLLLKFLHTHFPFSPL